jgi:anti-sigma B factor antagonist
MLLLLRIVERLDHLVVSCKGDLDFDSADILVNAVSDGLASGNIHTVLDLNHVTFIDCAALRSLAIADQMLTDAGGSLAIVCNNEFVLRLLELSGLDEELDVFDSLSAAGARPTDDQFAQQGQVGLG